MRKEHANLSTKHEQAVTALQRKLKDARTALRSQHSTPVLPAAPTAALLPMPPASMPSSSTTLAPAFTSAPQRSATDAAVDSQAQPSAHVSESASITEVVVLQPGHERECEQLEARSARLEKELAAAEAQLKALVREVDIAEPAGATQGAASRTVAPSSVHRITYRPSCLLFICTSTSLCISSKQRVHGASEGRR